MMWSGSKGISLIEVLVAFVVLGIGLSVLIPSQGRLATVPVVKFNDYVLKEFAMTEILLVQYASGTRPYRIKEPAWVADIKLNDAAGSSLKSITVWDRLSGLVLFEMTLEGMN